MSRSPLLSSNNYYSYKRNQFKSQRRNTQKRPQGKSQFQNDDQIFNTIIKQTQTPSHPVTLITPDKEDTDQDQDYPMKLKFNSSRKTSSNLPTANNSRTQTPKTSFDLDETQNQNFQNPLFQKAVYDKLSKRKWSRDSDNANSPKSNHDEHFYSNQQYKTKADDFKTKYKTELCKYYEINGTCKFGDNVS